MCFGSWLCHFSSRFFSQCVYFVSLCCRVHSFLTAPQTPSVPHVNCNPSGEPLRNPSHILRDGPKSQKGLRDWLDEGCFIMHVRKTMHRTFSDIWQILLVTAAHRKVYRSLKNPRYYSSGPSHSALLTHCRDLQKEQA